MASRKPQKPKTVLSAIELSRGRLPKLTTEVMPTDKVRLELEIGNRFSKIAFRQIARSIVIEGPGSDPPDLLASEGTRKFGIEIVEVIHSGNAAKKALAKKYYERIGSELGKFKPRLLGLEIEFWDGDQELPFPPWSKEREREGIISLVMRDFEKNLPEFEKLPVGSIRNCTTIRGPNGEFIKFTAIRRTSKESATDYVFHSEFSPGELVTEMVTRLSIAVEKKINMYSGHCFSMPVWLLAYEVDFRRCGNGESPCVQIAHAKIEGQVNPFEEIWYLSVASAPVLGHIEQVWP